MKTMKKFASLALALILTLALAAPAMAAQVTITPAEGAGTGDKAETYTAYKIFDAVVTNENPNRPVTDPNGTASEFESVLYTIDSNENPIYNTIKNFGGENPAFKLTLKSGTVYYVEKARDFDVAELSEALMAVEGKSAVSTTTTEDPNHLNLADGYFLIVGSYGSKAILDTFGKENVEIQTKNKAPTIEKTTPPVEGLKIGDKVPFTITVTAQPGAENYVIHDTMGTGLDFNVANNDLVITMKVGKADATTVATSNYTVREHTGEGAHYGFDVTFTAEFLKTITKPDTKIILKYSATINSNATLVTNPVTNKANLDYGDSNATPDSDNTQVEIPLYEFDLVKTTSANTLLAGAKFQLKSGDNAISLVLDGEAYRPAVAGETGETEIETNNTSVITFKGLGAGTYTLEETEAPSGYNKLAEAISVTFGKTTNSEGEEITLGSNRVNQNAITTTPAEGETPARTTYNPTAGGGVQVVNYTGAEMPSTGGIGTTIFYIVGGLLVVGAGVLLVTKKRMSGEEE